MIDQPFRHLPQDPRIEEQSVLSPARIEVFCEPAPGAHCHCDDLQARLVGATVDLCEILLDPRIDSLSGQITVEIVDAAIHKQGCQPQGLHLGEDVLLPAASHLVCHVPPFSEIKELATRTRFAQLLEIAASTRALVSDRIAESCDNVAT